MQINYPGVVIVRQSLLTQFFRLIHLIEPKLISTTQIF